MEIGPAENWEGMPGVVEVSGPTIVSPQLDLSFGMVLLVLALAAILFALFAFRRWVSPNMPDWVQWEPGPEAAEPDGATAREAVPGPTAPAGSGPGTKPWQQQPAPAPLGPVPQTATTGAAAESAPSAAAPVSSPQARFHRQAMTWVLAIAGAQVAIYVLLLLVPLFDYHELRQGWFGLVSPSMLSGAADANLELMIREFGRPTGYGFAVAQSVLSVLALPLIVGFVWLGHRVARFSVLKVEGTFLFIGIGLIVFYWHFLMPEFIGRRSRGEGLIIMIYPVTALLGSLAIGLGIGQLIARGRSEAGQIRE